MNDHHTTLWAKFIAFLSWLAAALSVGTIAGVVNIFVGAASGIWIVIQVANYFTYTRPINKIRLAAAKAGEMDMCETDKGAL